MTDPGPAVALLFDDSELGGQLREALHERGARIVHEGELASLDRDLLQQSGAEVLVVNLDDRADDALDHLYELIDGDRPRLVFNDAQASRGLLGWDRARWARHLAAKVLATVDIDPPRPLQARAIEPPVPVIPEPDAPVEADAVTEMAGDLEEEYPIGQPEPEILPPTEPELDDEIGHLDGESAAAASESLASELEALLASGELPSEDEEESGPGLRYFDNEALHDGNFGQAEPPVGSEQDDDKVEHGTSSSVAAESLAAVVPEPLADRGLELSALSDPSLATEPATAAEPVAATAPPSVKAPEGWALLDEDAAPAEPASADEADAAAFGIQKMSAADFLAPDVEAGAAEFEPTMSLELVSIEEAIAPQAYVSEHEMVLDELGTALSRIVLLGAAVDGIDSVCDFLAALPATTRLTFLHTQHLAGRAESALLDRLAASCALPVSMARQGQRADAGEVLLVPVGQQVRLRRDGSVELQAIGAQDDLDPSIDASLTMAANAFGRDAVAIVFAGRGTDAVAGAQAIHDRGGQVWVESSSGEHFADMVSGIFAERLVGFSGTPHELAAHLIEVFP